VCFPFAQSDCEIGPFDVTFVVQPALLVAVFRADFTVAVRIVSQETSTRRPPGISAISLRLNLERKQRQIACWMTAARKRCHMQAFRAIGLSPEADDIGLRRDWSAQA
jgi:hypothetical protein